MITSVWKQIGIRPGSKDTYTVYFNGYRNSKKYVCFTETLPESVRRFIHNATETYEPIGCYTLYK